MKENIKEISKLMTQVNLIDFGQSRFYRDKETGEHLPNLNNITYPGNAIFCSRNLIKGDTPSRRDDIIQIV